MYLTLSLISLFPILLFHHHLLLLLLLLLRLLLLPLFIFTTFMIIISSIVSTVANTGSETTAASSTAAIITTTITFLLSTDLQLYLCKSCFSWKHSIQMFNCMILSFEIIWMYCISPKASQKNLVRIISLSITDCWYNPAASMMFLFPPTDSMQAHKESCFVSSSWN